jgi:hypothetical protein
MKELQPNAERASRLVRFEGWDNPFQLVTRICKTPGCPCNNALFSLAERREGGRELAGGLRFDIWVDTHTGERSDDKPLRPQAQPLLEELLRDLPADWLEELAREVAARQQGEQREREAREAAARAQEQRRLDAHRLPPGEVRRGNLQSYLHIVLEEGSLLEGGKAARYLIERGERRFYFDEAFCPQPDCDCQNATLRGAELIPRGDGTADLRHVFHATIPLDGGPARLEDCWHIPRQEAEALLAAWRDKYTLDYPLLREHYQAIKAIGVRSLTAAPRTTGGRRPARNQACPCGSGRKYKACCGRRGR